MNKIIREHFPVSRLPDELRGDMDLSSTVTVTIAPDEAPPPTIMSLAEIFALDGFSRLSAEGYHRSRQAECETNGMAEVAAGAIYLDTNVFIISVEGDNAAAAPARGLLDALNRHPTLAVTSEITLAEVLAPPSRADALPPHIKRRAYLDLILWGNFIRLIPVSRTILIETADLRAHASYKLPDAIHVVSAIHSGCRYFVSAD